MFQNLFGFELWCAPLGLPVKVGLEGKAHGLVVDVFQCPLSTSTGGGCERDADRCRGQPWDRPSGRLQTGLSLLLYLQALTGPSSCSLGSSLVACPGPPSLGLLPHGAWTLRNLALAFEWAPCDAVDGLLNSRGTDFCLTSKRQTGKNSNLQKKKQKTCITTS